MCVFIRALGPMSVFALAVASVAPAATPKQIDAAIRKGAEALKAKYAKGAPDPTPGGDNHGVGPTCLAGLALLESGTPVTDPALKSITTIVRDAAFTSHKTYQVSLCLMFLDRLGDPVDVPLIQALAMRLLVGQTRNGGWTYEACGDVSQADAQRLRAMKPNQTPGKVHPEVEKYRLALIAGGGQSSVAGVAGGEDNSNTQFAVIAIWLARKHGVPVEGSLDAVEKRFLATQNMRTGGWTYAGLGPGIAGLGPSMHCAGLIGLATAVARREDRLKKPEPAKKDDSTKVEPGGIPKKGADDPFFNPPTSGGSDPKKPNAPARQPDFRDKAVQIGLIGLGQILAESAKAGRGALALSGGGGGGGFGNHDLYFFWSLERVGMIYGIDKIGGVDWYDAGATTLVQSQAQDGTWKGAYSPEIDTSFAVLFLCKSNLARDLSSKVQKEVSTEMRAGAGPTNPGPKPADPGASANPNAIVPDPVLLGPNGSEAAIAAGELMRAPDKDWATALKKLRDTKGPIYTQALVAAVSRLEGDRRKDARAALAERLTRMTAETLRTMAKDEEAELRRGAVLAMAMKDDKAHLPDLIAALLDDEDSVIRAAKAGLKSMTNQDFGPRTNPTAGDKKLAVTAWNEWLGKQKR